MTPIIAPHIAPILAIVTVDFEELKQYTDEQ